MSRYNYSNLMLLVLIFLSACTNSSTNIIDYNLFCRDVVCWEGIIPNVTTRRDATRLLEENTEFSSIVSTVNSITWQSATYDGRLSLDQQGIVFSIHIQFSERRLNITEFINHVGQPSRLELVRLNSGELTCSYPIIIFSDLTIILQPQFTPNQAQIEPLQLITSLRILPPEHSVSGLHSISVDWQGFVDYCSLVVD